ncbi:hypothetical protein BKI52_13240 [marine bacterium AO1-C]|nr:hypothetical protein BKI52_13240 [marine bacterium AO1-C]
MKKQLEKLSTFKFTLRIFAFFAKRKIFTRFTQFLTTKSAKLNIKLNNPQPATDAKALAKVWQQMMPPDAQDKFTIGKIDQDTDTARVKIGIKCPLRGTGNVEACYKLMNYDRTLMKAVGGELIVEKSQSNSGEGHCILAIRKLGADTSDITPAHLKPSPTKTAL